MDPTPVCHRKSLSLIREFPFRDFKQGNRQLSLRIALLFIIPSLFVVTVMDFRNPLIEQKTSQ
jgi:hypothetical protein